MALPVGSVDRTRQAVPPVKRQWKQEVIERAGRSERSLVYAGHRFERRALERMSARGEAERVVGMPPVWLVVPPREA